MPVFPFSVERGKPGVARYDRSAWGSAERG